MRTLKFSALALATVHLLVWVPTVTFAVGTCSLTALDTVAGLGTQVTIDGCEKSKQLQLNVTGPSGATYHQTVATDAEGKATTLVPSKSTVTAGTYTVALGNDSANFSVIADRADDAHSILSASPKAVATDYEGAITVTAVLRDRYDNPIIGRPIALISTRQSDDISPQMNQTDDDGRFLWTVRPVESGVMSLVLYDIITGKQMKLRTDVTVGTTKSTPSWMRASLTGNEMGGETGTDTLTVDHFDIELPQKITEIKVNELFSMTIRAMRGQDIVRSYIGSLGVKSSDPDAELPKKGTDPSDPSKGRVDILNVHQGVALVPLATMFRSRGTQTISVYDKLDPSIKGEITLNVVGSDGAQEKIVIVDPKDGSKIKRSDSILLQGKGPSLINVKVIGGQETVLGEIGADNIFRINVPLNPEYKEVTLFVASENGTYESQPVHIIIDNDAPKIDNVSMNPTEGKTEEKAIISVRAEADLVSVVATIDGKDTALTASGKDLYIASVVAPLKDGVYDRKVIAKDSVGNEGTAFMKWTVTTKTVPMVEGVTSEAQAGQVLLRWKALENTPLSQYKVYVATEEDPTNYLYSFGTKNPTSTSVIIKDLPFGKKYLFSLTAVRVDGAESNQKSIAVAASPLGFSLNIKPGKDHALLEWNIMPNLPLANYILEYGTEPGQYTEKRTVNGNASSVMVRDLIPEITYEFKLTPVTVTGKVMTELAAIGHVLLSSTGYTIGAADPAPDDVFNKLHSGADVSPHLKDVPMTTTSGISTMVAGMILIVSVIVGLSWLKLRRERKIVQEFLRSLQERPHT